MSAPIKIQDIPFILDTQRATGYSADSIARDLFISERIPRLQDLIRTTLDTSDELMALAQLSPRRQNPFIDRAMRGENVSVVAETRRNAQ